MMPQFSQLQEVHNDLDRKAKRLDNQAEFAKISKINDWPLAPRGPPQMRAVDLDRRHYDENPSRGSASQDT